MKKNFLVLFAVFLICFNFWGCTQSENNFSLGNVMILGDSHSTFAGYIPDNYITWYKPETDTNNVTRVEDTWWHLLVNNTTNSKLLLNASYSGSTISYTGYDEQYASSISFITRLDNIISDREIDLNSINTLLIYGGINDIAVQAPLGEFKYDNITEQDLYCFYPAVINLFQKAKQSLPNARILFVINDELNEYICQDLISICETTNVEYIVLQNISKMDYHPDIEGMNKIYTQIYNYFENNK
jgi:hypothetical protein